MVKESDKHFSEEAIQISTKQMERCSKSFITEEMQNKSAINQQTPTKMAKIKEPDEIKCW